MYKKHLHGISEVTEDKITDKVVNMSACEGVCIGDVLTRSTRVSLTIRYVPRTIKTNLLFGRKR